MDRDYDIFETFPDGEISWHTCVLGLENAQLKVAQLGTLSSNEFFALHSPTQEVVARVNHDRAKSAHQP